MAEGKTPGRFVLECSTLRLPRNHVDIQQAPLDGAIAKCGEAVENVTA